MWWAKPCDRDKCLWSQRWNRGCWSSYTTMRSSCVISCGRLLLRHYQSCASSRFHILWNWNASSRILKIPKSSGSCSHSGSRLVVTFLNAVFIIFFKGWIYNIFQRLMGWSLANGLALLGDGGTFKRLEKVESLGAMPVRSRLKSCHHHPPLCSIHQGTSSLQCPERPWWCPVFTSPNTTGMSNYGYMNPCNHKPK